MHTTSAAKLIISMFSKIATGAMKPKSAALKGALASHAAKLIQNSSIRLSIAQSHTLFAIINPEIRQSSRYKSGT